MGIGSNVLSLLLELRRAGRLPLRGAVAEIGAQQLSNTFLEARWELAAAQVLFETGAPSPLPAPVPTGLPDYRLSAASPPSRQFWYWIGYDYVSIDVDGTPGSIPLDLNYDEIPKRSRNKFDLVTNCGTTEHVANQLHAFKIIHELTKPGGVMLHHLPMQGDPNHGLFNYNPKFFWMLSRSNDYEFVYFDFSDDRSFLAPDNLLDFTATFVPDARERLGSCQFTDSYLLVALKKVHDLPYVSPLDVPTGAATNNEVLRRRYWGVFMPERFKTS